MCVLIFWRESPVGVISLAMMCGGDGKPLQKFSSTGLPYYVVEFSNDSFSTSCCVGVADIMGRKFGSVKIPYNKNKSWAGSISMFIFGFLISMG